MQIVLITVFGKKGYAQYRLPPKKNIDHTLWLLAEVFQEEHTIQICLENIDNFWYIKAAEYYLFTITDSDISQYVSEKNGSKRMRLEAGDSFEIRAVSGEIYTAAVRSIPSGIYPFSKFVIQKDISIGRNDDNDIVIHNDKSVSRIHAKIIRSGGQWKIVSYSINGFYINGRFRETSSMLAFGDDINIMGFHFIFLENYIALDEKKQNYMVNFSEGLYKVPHQHLLAGREDTASEDDVSLSDRRKPYNDKNRCQNIVLVHRSPRVIEEVNTEPVRIDPPPEMEESGKTAVGLTILSSILMSVPMISGSLFMIYASEREGGGQQIYMYGSLLMVSLSVVMALIWTFIQNFSDRKKEEKYQCHIQKKYHQYLREQEELIRERYTDTQTVLNQRYISAQNCVDMKTWYGMLWARAPYHKDFLDCRIGLGSMKLPSEIRIADKHFQLRDNVLFQEMEELKEKYQILTEVPITIALNKEGEIGLVAIEEQDRMQLARNIVIQLAFHNCYTEVRLGVIYDSERSQCTGGWDFMRWLPHIWSEKREFRWMASNQEEARTLFFRLMQIIMKRKESKETSLPYYILFIAAPHFLEGEPVETYLPVKGTSYGIIVIWLSPQREQLPKSCRYIIENNIGFRGIYQLWKGKKEALDMDVISELSSDCFARQLSIFRVNDRIENKDIPLDVTFLQLFEAESMEELNIENNWKKNRTMSSLRAPVGRKAGGKINYLDIHEKYHGPHGLIAGTTGSGKSELLQTYLLSMMILYGPESVNMFLIDYKGGGMSGLFDGVPHLAGQISNLSGAGISRAMTALHSENQRRQRLFQKYKVNNINAYTRLYYDSDDMDPMPHLLIIVDEFAELKKEEPDFMQELISIVQVGRSLGLHLILATQKPGGTVDDKIWSNSRFRLCLRVQEKQDSIDMLHKPDAAEIQQAGRCCFQVGNDEIYEVFQSGWSGAPYTTNPALKKNAELIRLSGEADDGLTQRETSEEIRITQFEAVKTFIIKTAEHMGINRGRQMWMDPLPKRLVLSDITCDLCEKGQAGSNIFNQNGKTGKAYHDAGESRKGKFCIGLVDDPASQSQYPLLLNPERHAVVCGLPMSGKSTFLQTILWQLVNQYQPEELHVYIIDYSSSGLKAFEKMPQVGGVVLEGEEQKSTSLFHILVQILEERKQLFQGGNYREYVRTQKGHIPRIIVMIDNFAAFNEKTKQRFEDRLLQLFKEGENAGIIFIISCGGFSINEFPIRFSNYFKSVFCLEMKDHFAYAEIFGILSVPVIPDKGIHGRGITYIGDRLLEFQTALASDSEDDYARLNLIRETASMQSKTWTGILPRQVRSIPDKPMIDDYYKLEEVTDILSRPGLLPIGFWKTTSEICFLDMRVIFCYVISGKKRTGKHNLMRMMIESLKRKIDRGQDEKIFLIDTGGYFTPYKEEACIAGYMDNLPMFRSFLEELELIIQNRSQQSILEGREKINQNYYIFIENLPELLTDDTDKEKIYDMISLYSRVRKQEIGSDITFIGIAEEDEYFSLCESDAWNQLCSQKAGIHLGGSLIEDNIFEHENLSYEDQMTVLGVGEGYVFSAEDSPKKVIVPRC